MMLQQHQGLIGGGGGGGNSGDSAAAAAAAAAQAQEYSGIGGELGGGGAGSGGFSEEERGGGRIDDGERNSGGNRWPRQETLALLKIRSDMDTVFRDSSLKGPLWDEVSRKLAELGYHRSAKKCKEKFENVYKYHKRTKDGRTSKADGKTYRFFDQLEALETTTHPPPPPASAKPFLQAVPPMPNTNGGGGGGGGGGGANTTAPPPPPQPNAVSSSAAPQVITTVPSSAMNNVAGATVAVNHPAQPQQQQQQQQQQQAAQNHGFMFSNVNAALSNYSTSSSSSTDSEEPVEKRRKRKRKWKDFFGRLMKEVIDKQEELQSKFLETLEKRERERIAREEAWRVQEMAKMNREHDMLVQERSIAAAKDAAVISFLQKIAEQQQNSPGIPTTPQSQSQSQPQSQPPPTAPVPAITPPPAAAQIPFQLTIQPQPAPPPPQPSGIQQQRHQQPPPTVVPTPVPVPGAAPISLPPVIKNLDLTGKAIVSAAADNGGGGDLLSPSPSRWPKAEVQALINLRTTLDVKYQENGPKGPLWEEISSSMKKLGYNRNAKRCKEKWENINKYYKKVKESSKKRPEDSKTCPYFHQLDAIYREKANSGFGSGVPKPENQQAAPIMARPEQQWPPSIEQQRSESAENMDQNDEDEDDDDDEDEAGEYEIVTNKTSTMASSIE